jgi:hypothetical protein
LVAGGIAAARKRRRALIGAALGVAAGTIMIGIGLVIGRNLYLNGIPTDKLPRETAAYLFGTIFRFLRSGIQLAPLVALLVALGSWVSGPSRPAVAARRAVASAPRALGRKFETGLVGPVVARYAMATGGVYHPRREQRSNDVPTVRGRRYDAFCWFDQTRALHPLPARFAEPKEPMVDVHRDQ